MSERIKQLETPEQDAGRKAAVLTGVIQLNTNIAYILLLALILIPTLSGVALIS